MVETALEAEVAATSTEYQKVPPFIQPDDNKTVENLDYKILRAAPFTEARKDTMTAAYKTSALTPGRGWWRCRKPALPGRGCPRGVPHPHSAMEAGAPFPSILRFAAEVPRLLPGEGGGTDMYGGICEISR